jgi:hypothetical protein
MKNKLVSISLVLFFSLLTLNCVEEPEIFTKGPGQVLLVGNSLTYANDMPLIFEELGAAFGFDLRADVMAYPNYGLEDHWKEGQLRNFLEAYGYEFVVFQQGPSSQEEGRASLLKYGSEIAAFAKEQGTVPAFFMVWPAITYYDTFDGVIANYTAAAEQTSSLLVPVGEYWKDYRSKQNTIELYTTDGFHPSTAGSFLAALTIFHELYPEYDLEELDFRDFRSYVNQEFAFNELRNLVLSE